MYKVLIIDDELLVRVGLKTTIDWEEIGFTVVGEASNGEQGYKQYKKYLPDVIITDIKMPKKDGLWLIEEIRKENEHAKILVLTCYDEFSFARKALKAGADDYILKSEVEDEELIEIMQSIKNKIDKQSKAANIQNKAKINQNDSRKSLLNDMIKGDFNIDDKLLERCEGLNFNISKSKFSFASIAISEETIKNVSEVGSLRQINNAIRNIIFYQLADREIQYIYNDSMKKYVFLFSSPELTLGEIKRIFTVVSNAAKQYFDISLNIIYTQPFEDRNNISIVFKDFMDKSQILFYDNKRAPFTLNVNNISFTNVDVFDLKKEYNKNFNEFIGKENKDEANKFIYDISDYFEKNSVNPKAVKIFYSNLIGDMFNSYGKLFESNEEIFNYEHYHYKIVNCENLKSILQLLMNLIDKVIDQIKLSRNNNSKSIISMALTYIENNYDRRISLEDVASEVHLSKHYLCNVFKKETGENMSLYINKLRIEKAKNLLLKSDCKIKEIFEEVGYSNQQYFSKVFKKITGMTIMEYRESKNDS